MSVIIHKHVYCDSCNEPWEEAVDGRYTIPLQRKVAKRAGWLRIKWNGRLIDICDGCAREHPSQRQSRERRAR